MQLSFVCEQDSPTQLSAQVEYGQIWDEYGSKIIQAYETHGGYAFPVTELTATIHDGISQSHPLKFQANIERGQKLGDLIHELGHVYIVDGNQSEPFREEYGDRNVRSHKKLDLLLYEVLREVCGKDFADREVERESQFSPAYAEAWSWALNMSANERKAYFASTLKRRF